MDIESGYKTAFAGALIGGATGSQEAAVLGAKIGGTVGLAMGTIDSSPKIKMAIGNFLSSLNEIEGISRSSTATLIRLGLYEAGDYAKDSNLPK